MQLDRTAKGYILGAVAAVSYGTNPLFAVPLYRHGLNTGSVLFYRYAFAVVILGIVMLYKGHSFRLSGRRLPLMVAEGVLFALSSVFLFDAYRYMDVGIASTLLFVEPVFIALILRMFYRQKISLVSAISIFVCAGGVVLLSNPGTGAYVTLTGVVLVMLASLAYAIYMIFINKTSLQRLQGTTITFYSLLFGIIVFAFRLNGFTDLQPVPFEPLGVACVVGVAVVPTIVSLLTVAVSIQIIGPVSVSILGALEPLTGVFFGVLLFGEHLTVKASAGIILIVTSVLIIVCAPYIKKHNKTNH
ncbi:MAG: DMT family transporter [Duncaniella sp.]|nr:DMT family transporter [Duncaniella sp.]